MTLGYRIFIKKSPVIFIKPLLALSKPSLFAALKLERVAMGGVLVMVMIIASFSIAGVVLLTTASKRKDIAILESMGMTRKSIGRIFMAHAGLIGAIGSGIGLVLGLCVCVALAKWPLRLPDSYYLDWLPVELNIGASIAFASIGIVLAVVASIFPMRQAMRTAPLEIIRYE